MGLGVHLPTVYSFGILILGIIIPSRRDSPQVDMVIYLSFCPAAWSLAIMTIQCLSLFACFNHGATGVGQCLYLRFLGCYFWPVPFSRHACFMTLFCMSHCLPSVLGSWQFEREGEAQSDMDKSGVWIWATFADFPICVFSLVIYEVFRIGDIFQPQCSSSI